MTDEAVYERLAEALDRLPNGFPRTPGRAEIRILQKIFSPEEAWLASGLSGRMEPTEEIARRLEMPSEEARARLIQMARRGLAWFDKKEAGGRFRLAPFVVGIYEAQFGNLDEELARLVEDYLADGGAVGIMKPQPALHRVVPAHGAVRAEWVLPYDDVRAILESAKVFAVRGCICRAQTARLGRSCDFPTNNCLSFSIGERPPREGDISREEALSILEQSEEVGLVHTVSNVIEGVGYVCNCCGCCCTLLRGITEWGVSNAVAYAAYYAEVDPELCAGCGTCEARCQVRAIATSDGLSAVDRPRCIGCGLCVTGCTTGAAILRRRPEAEIVRPPVDFAAWEQERLRNRELV